MKIYAQTLIKKDLNGRYGPYTSYIIQGNYNETYPIKDKLKTLGFRFVGKKWQISENKFNQNKDYILNSLKKLNVRIEGEEQPQKPITPQKPLTPSEMQEEKKEEKKIWQTENEEMSRWYGFPINSNIMQFTQNVFVEDDGEEFIYPINVSINRTYQLSTKDRYKETKSKQHKMIPIYEIKYSNNDINFSATKRLASKKKWGEYDENQLLSNLKENIEKQLANKDSQFNKTFENNHYVQRRSDDYKNFLLNLKDNPAVFYIEINSENPEDTKYNGTYKMATSGIYNENEIDVTLITNLDHELAPYPDYLAFDIDISKTKNSDDFYKTVNEYILNKKDEIQSKYLKYLKSFPFEQNQNEKAVEDFIKIIDLIKSDNYVSIFNVIKQKGYIRASKKQKQQIGLSKGNQIKWIVDDKLIRDDIYSNRFLKNSPDFFFTVVAYYVMRKVRNIQSFTDMMLSDSIHQWFKTMSKMDNKNLLSGFDFNKIYDAFDKISETIIYYITDHSKKREEEKISKLNFKNEYVSQLINLANEYDILSNLNPEWKQLLNTEEINDKEKMSAFLKNIYRKLSMALHPDLTTDPEEKIEREEKFKNLQNIWDNIPNFIKNSFNWYVMYKIG